MLVGGLENLLLLCTMSVTLVASIYVELGRCPVSLKKEAGFGEDEECSNEPSFLLSFILA
jgi:hypothetical protein